MQRTINLSPVNYWTEQPFLDRMRAALVAKNGGGQRYILAPLDSGAGATFVVTWKGGGVVSPGPGCQQVSQVPGRLVFRGDGKGNGQGAYMFTPRGGDAQTGFRMVRMDEEPRLALGEVFRSDYLNDLTRFDAIRFMDWFATNHSPRTDMDMAQLRLAVDLCNVTGTRPWICVPHLITDAALKTVVSMLNEAAFSPPVLEFSNEVWNWQFGQTKYAAKGGRDKDLWYGQQVVRVLDAAKGTRCRVVASGQLYNPGIFRQVLAGLGAHASQLEGICVTTYVDGLMNRPESQPAVQALMKAGDVTGALQMIRAYLPRQRALYAPWQAYCQAAGVPLWAYEGGQYHLNSRGLPEQDKLRAFFYAVQMDPRSADVLEEYYRMFAEVGGQMDAVYNLASGSTLDGFFGIKLQPIWARLARGARSAREAPPVSELLNFADQMVAGLNRLAGIRKV